MTDHKTGTREEWLAARLELLEAEKAMSRRGDELARQRQELPWVRIGKEYLFEGPQGPGTAGRVVRRQQPADRRAHHVRPRLGRAVPGLPELHW